MLKEREEQIKNLKNQQESLMDDLKAEQQFLSGLLSENNQGEAQELGDLSMKELNVKTKVMCEVLQQSLREKLEQVDNLQNQKDNLER